MQVYMSAKMCLLRGVGEVGMRGVSECMWCTDYKGRKILYYIN